MLAFEFGMWISAEFKIYLIKEFQRLKEQKYKQMGWDIRRNLTKHPVRITDYVIPMPSFLHLRAVPEMHLFEVSGCLLV